MDTNSEASTPDFGANMLAPIWILSDDILGSIFIWCARSDAPNMNGTPNSLDVFSWPPWVISHVCRRWRGISLAHKDLWSTLGLYLAPCRVVSTQLLEVMLQRSAPCALDISIDFKATGQLESKEFFQNHFAKILKGITPRIRALRVPQPYITLALLEGCQLESLEYLQLEYRDRPANWGLTGITCPSFEMPKLHTLVFSFATPSHLDLPWAQLKNVALGSFQAATLGLFADTGLEVLQLRHLLYSNDHLPRHNNFPCMPLTFPKLHTLWIEGFTDELPYLLARVCGPNLKTLKIAVYNEDEELTMLPPVVHHPGSIERLDLAFKNTVGVTLQDITNFFKPLFNVRECYVALPNDEMRALFRGLSAGDPILPRLRILRLSADGLELYMDELSQAIEARKAIHYVEKLVALEVSLLVIRGPGDEWDGELPNYDARGDSVAKLRELLDCDVSMNSTLRGNAPWSVLQPFASRNMRMNLDVTLYYS
ncbi:hypothetical protein CYLTODRAFT_456804 [Cylindrobasidium torrendii FP15055 ss-10]|uniref:F-box domain-containing protein n=1 Tax=Cylindrobasidium torrendii FP15055 ss-10 TaxID=1314674 RepID=A0A0D7B339_9AGAR|nr:hypothetical protein CYLTODRAFT_456804 [Cylindrobasidium torrendii FP15055 ss-10]